MAPAPAGGHRACGPDPARAPVDRGEGGTTPRSGLRVLIVEDSRAVAERIVETLATSLPIDCAVAVDAEPEALSARGPWDVAIVDLGLREGNGFSVVRELRRRAEPVPLVIVLSEYARPEFRALAATLGAHAFLDKAREFERLVDLVRSSATVRGAEHPRH